jgi:putative methylase
MGLSKKQLAIILSKLKVFEKPRVRFEQYPTDSNVAADLLWNMMLLGDTLDKKIIDLGSGTGILSIGALFCGAKQITGYEIDQKAIDIAKENYRTVQEEFEFPGKIEFKKGDVLEIIDKSDIVIQNPPFGTRDKHIDKEFLTKAIYTGNITYSLHKSTTIDYLKDFIVKKGAKVSHSWRYQFPLKQTLEQHRRKIQIIDVTALRIIK